MKKAKVKASSSAAAEMLANGSTGFGGGFGGGFGAAFGSAFASFGSSAATSDAAADDATSSSSTAAATPSPAPTTDAWAALMHARSHEAQEVTDPVLVLALKQLAKRDPITRLKALETLSTAFAAMDSTEAVRTLPPWLLAQDRLHLDNDRRVREAVWTSFGTLRSLCGKQFAPHMKAAFPLWWTHQADPCKEVARAATKEWQLAFPARPKQVQAAIYCHREYFAYCSALFAHTPATLSDQTVYSVEESAERWERATVSAITSLAEFIDLTSTLADAAAATPAAPAATVSLAAYTALLQPAVLSKFARSKQVHIRRALYGLLKSLVTNDPSGFVAAHMETLAPLVINDLLEEPTHTNHQAMLDCVLSLLRKHANDVWVVLLRPAAGSRTPLVVSTFFPRLKTLLTTGLAGNYTAVYPCVLPLLSFIPDSVMLLAPATAASTSAAAAASSSSPLAAFYNFLFSNLWSARGTLHDAGGALLSLQGQSKELVALIDAYVECLVYVLRKRRGDRQLQQTLVTQHLLAQFLAPALHFACPAISHVSDPSVTAEAVQLNRFGSVLFERAGRGVREASAHLEREDQAALWTQIERACLEALTSSTTTATTDEMPNASPALTATTSASSPHKRNNVSAAAAQPIDAYIAVGLLLQAQQTSDATAAVVEGRAPLLRTVASVFHLALTQFGEVPFSRISSLKLVVQLGEVYSLVSILSASPSSPSLPSFLSSTLLPALRQLLVTVGNTPEADFGATKMHASYVDTVELFSRGLLSKAIDELGLASAADETEEPTASASAPPPAVNLSVWEELVRLLASSTISASASIAAARLHLALLRVIFTFIFAKCPTVHGHAALQDLIVTQAENLLTCEKTELLPEYVGIFRSVISTPGLLAADVLSALLSSFLEAVEAFSSMEGDLSMATRGADQATSSLGRTFVRKFEADTGCTIQALPSLIEVLGGLLVGETTITRAMPVATEADAMRAGIIKAVFWLQHSPREAVATQAARVWSRLDSGLFKEHPTIVVEIATIFRQRVLSAPLVTFTSEFIVAWSAWLVQLFEGVRHPYLQQKVIDAALPSHVDLRNMLADVGSVSTPLADIAERLRVVRDLISELHLGPSLTERVLFLGEASPSASVASSALKWEGQPRLTLLVDLLAVEEFLGAFETDANLTVLRRAPGAIPFKQSEDEDEHVATTSARLEAYIASSLLTGTQLVAMTKTALTESQAIVKDAQPTSIALERAVDSGRAYTGALKKLLQFARNGDQPTANALRTLLATYLATVKVDQIRSHTHGALSLPFESTLVAVLESGALANGGAVVEAAIANLIKWTQEGFDAGVRLLAKQNGRLFDLSSLLRIQAALLRSLDGSSSSVELLTTFRARLITATSALNLFEALANGADGFSTQATRFFDARSNLLQALVVQVGETLEPQLVQTIVLWAVSVLKFAVNQHAVALRAPSSSAISSSSSSSSVVASSSRPVSAAWCFNYLSSTIRLMSSLAPILLPSASSDLSSHSGVSAALHSFVSICYGLLVSPSSARILQAISFKAFTETSLDLEAVIRAYREQRPLKLVEIVREDLRKQSGGDAADSAAVPTLFKLLAHPLPSYALCALHFLSLGLLDRAVCVPIVFEIDEAEEMAHVLASLAAMQQKQGKKKRGPPTVTVTETEAEHAENEAEHQRKTMRNEYHRLVTQSRLDQLVPATLLAILDQRCHVDDTEQPTEDEDEAEDAPFFAHRPVALQLRAHLLVWSLVLDLLSQSLPAPAGASSSSSSAPICLSLSDDKSSLLLSHLRESDLIAPFASELVEHMLVSLPESEVEHLVLRTIKNFEHREAASEQTEEEPEVVEPAVLVEDEDEDGNVIARAPLATPATAVPTVMQTIREFPLWHSPAILVGNSPLADLKVLPSLMKRLMRLRRHADSAGAHAEEVFHGRLACLLYLRTLRVLPALSRSWFTHVDRSSGAVINRLTSAAFSPLLIQDELLNVMQQQAAATTAAAQSGVDDDDEEQFDITTNYQPGSYGAKYLASTPAVVHARFARGEIVMGMSIKLASCHPLVPVTVTLQEQVKLKGDLSKKWTLAIASILASADGSMYSAIGVWKKNLDQHFAGVSECTICYSVVSAQNHSLPRMRCTECNNKFHSACLYKWFQSSGNSKCPLCRSVFSA